MASASCKNLGERGDRRSGYVRLSRQKEGPDDGNPSTEA